MIKRLLILTLNCCLIQFSQAQTPKIKSVSKLTYDYSLTPFGAKVLLDTNVIEYAFDGKINYTNQKSNFRYPAPVAILIDSVLILDSTNTNVHKRMYKSDTTITEVFVKNYGDSIIEIEIGKLDTIRVSKSYYRGKKIVKTTEQFSRKVGGSYSVVFYKRKSKKIIKAIALTTYLNGTQDSVQIINHGKRKCYKKFEFNENKKEWFLKLKLKRTKYKEIVCETFFNEYYQIYFTKKKTTIFNNFGLPISETTFDKYLAQIEKKVIYKYEFY